MDPGTAEDIATSAVACILERDLLDRDIGNQPVPRQTLGGASSRRKSLIMPPRKLARRPSGWKRKQSSAELEVQLTTSIPRAASCSASRRKRLAHRPIWPADGLLIGLA
jgi:hypothetical protein